MLNSQSWNRGWHNSPLIVRVVVVFTLIATIGGEAFFGYQVAGLAWFISLLVALLILITKRGRIKFPLAFWLPWIVLVLFYLVVGEAQNALQRSVMLLCPLVVGVAVSKLNIGKRELDGFWLLCRYLGIAVIVVVILKAGILATGQLPGVTGLAAEVMTATLLCSLFAASHAGGDKKALIWWSALAAIPLVAVTRTAIAVAGLSLPLTFAPMGIAKRLIIMALVSTTAFAVFNTERVQQKMFFSGSGTLSDMRRDNPDFRTTGRITILDAMEIEVEQAPWFGHGANSSEEFVVALTGGLTHPHNDWLRLAYDYGYVGVAIFALCLALQAFHAWRRARQSSGVARILFYAGASSFLSFSLLMFTDNIILYVAFFGNLQFTILGLAYAATAPKRRRSVSNTSHFRH